MQPNNGQSPPPRSHPFLARPEDVAERAEIFRLGLAGRHDEVKAKLFTALAAHQERINRRRLGLPA